MESNYKVAKKFANEYGFEDVSNTKFPWNGKEIYAPIFDMEKHKKDIPYFAGCNDFIGVEHNVAEWVDGDDYYFYLIETGLINQIGDETA